MNNRLKHLIAPFIVLCAYILGWALLMSLSSCAHQQQQAITEEIEAIVAEPTYLYEGELNPNEFKEWVVIKVMPFAAILRNPDPDSSIKKVVVLLDYNYDAIGYQYFKAAIPCKFLLDPEQNKFIQVDMAEAERQECLSCHKIQPTIYY